MKYDIILSGVGGHGILSMSTIIATGAIKEGMYVKQVDVHGMAQRGGMVVSNLRLSDKEIASDKIPLGTARMILSTEPLESIRYLEYLSPEGILITSIAPVINMLNYPEIDKLLHQIKQLPRSITVDAAAIAQNAGSYHTINIVMLGVASTHLPIKAETLKNMIIDKFKGKNNNFVEMNLKAFDFGREHSAENIER